MVYPLQDKLFGWVNTKVELVLRIHRCQKWSYKQKETSTTAHQNSVIEYYIKNPQNQRLTKDDEMGMQCLSKKVNFRSEISASGQKSIYNKQN